MIVIDTYHMLLLFCIFYRMSTQPTIEENALPGYIFILAPIILLFAISLIPSNKPTPKQKKEQIKNRGQAVAVKGKIVIALEIEGLLVSVRERWRLGWKQVPQPKESWFKNILRKIIGTGIYYKQIFPQKAIRQFLKQLKSIKNVHLFLYTSLPEAQALPILSLLQIDGFFPASHRKFLENFSDTHKHAIDVDQDTRRVVIITPNSEDVLEDDKHFWVVRVGGEGWLLWLSKTIRTLIQNNKNIDNLHEQLSQINMDSQSNQEQ